MTSGEKQILSELIAKYEKEMALYENSNDPSELYDLATQADALYGEEEPKVSDAFSLICDCSGLVLRESKAIHALLRRMLMRESESVRDNDQDADANRVGEMFMNTNQYEQKVYRAMKATLAIPAANINVIAQKCGMDFKELIGILEFVDREGYLSGLRFARGGHQGTALMAFTDSVGRTAKGNEFMKRFEREGIPHIDGESRPTVFISYNEETGTEFVDFLEKKLINCATVKRFTDMDHWASFTEFMRSIREQDFAVLVITEKYLRSVACMFEVSELMKDTNWKDKVMFAVLDKKIYGMAPELIQYWQGEMEQLNNKAKEINPVNMGPITDQLKRITAIQYYFGDFIETVRDSRNPSVWEITDAIISKIKEAVTDDFVDETENEIYVQKKQEEIDRLLR